jgi:hypothetical protein
MREALRRLSDLQQRIAQNADADRSPEYINRLCVTAVAGRVHLDFFGGPFGEAYQEVLAAVVSPEVSPVIRSLAIRGPDEGANGTRNWDFSPLAHSGAVFPQLRSVLIEQTKPADHNRTIVAAGYDEDGVLARLLAKAPDLESLVTPSAPSAEFFQVGERPLTFLSVDAGYDHQGFIRALAGSSCFPCLRCLEFGEYNETYMDDYAARCTPIDDYRELFTSAAFKPVGRFVWRNPAGPAEDIAKLRAHRPDLQLLVVRTSAEYVG